jgi:hypothetical protein
MELSCQNSRIVYEYQANPAEIPGFQNPRISAKFENHL